MGVHVTLWGLVRRNSDVIAVGVNAALWNLTKKPSDVIAVGVNTALWNLTKRNSDVIAVGVDVALWDITWTGACGLPEARYTKRGLERLQELTTPASWCGTFEVSG